MVEPTFRESFMGQIGFELDDFQLCAMDLIDRGESVLVAAPTGSGKTLVGQYAIRRALEHGGRAFYTTPLKALSNQKYVEFCAAFGSSEVGLLTGDNSIRSEASVVVMTTEVLRNMLYAGSHDLDRLEVVVLDEVHYLQNPYRGGVWEEVIIHLPQTVGLVCLSATVSNAEEFATWMKTVRGTMEAVIEERRPVDLNHLYLYGDRRTSQAELIPTFIDDKPNPDGSVYDAPWLADEIFRRKSRPKAYTPSRAETIRLMMSESLIPAIYFIFSRNSCDEAVRELLHAGLRLTSQAERLEIRSIVAERTSSIDKADLDVLGFDQWLAALEAGIASHHAGMVPPFREAVEACFERSLVKVVFATETLSLGINMPARSVVIEKLTKFNGERHDILSAGEYTQLAGRAGRRGIDDVGYCIVLWSSGTTFGQASSLASTRSYPITSSFRPNYNMASNLIKGFEPETVRHLLNLSFAQFRSDSEVVETEAELARLRRRLEESKREAECGFGDVFRYLSLKASKPELAQVDKVPMSKGIRLENLRPGDVLAVENDSSYQAAVVVVLSTGVRSNGNVKVSVLSGAGKVHRLGVANADACEAIGSVVLPRPYVPSDPVFQRKLLQLLTPFASPRYALVEPKLAKKKPVRSGKNLELIRVESTLMGCVDFRNHVTSARRAERLESKITELTSRVRSKLESLAIQFDRVTEVLEGLGFVENWQLTPSGERLSRLYTESDLLCALALEEGLFDGLGPESLAALLSSFTYEARPQFRGSPELPTKALAVRFAKAKEIRRRLVDLEIRSRLPQTKEPDPGFARMVFRWCQGRDLDEVIGHERLPAGDFVRNMKQLLDLLRQVAEVAPMESVRLAARQASQRMFRGVVAASSQVYFDIEPPEIEDQSLGDDAGLDLTGSYD